jgi:hypothetical protein
VWGPILERRRIAEAVIDVRCRSSSVVSPVASTGRHLARAARPVRRPRQSRKESKIAKEDFTGTIRACGGNLFIEPDAAGRGRRNAFLDRRLAQRGGLSPPFEGQRVRCEVVWDWAGNCVATQVFALPAPAEGENRQPRGKWARSGAPIRGSFTGTIGVRDGNLLIMPDEGSGALRSNTVHVSRYVARRDKLSPPVEPIEGRRVRVEVVHDEAGNCIATRIIWLPRSKGGDGPPAA